MEIFIALKNFDYEYNAKDKKYWEIKNLLLKP